MRPSQVLSFVVGLFACVLLSSNAQAQVSFPGPELLGRPTDHSVTINVVANAAIDAYFEYGTQAGGPYLLTSPAAGASGPASAAANTPLDVVLSGLSADTEYFYRMVYRQTGTSNWITRDEHSFHTQRLPGSTFSFTVGSDSHINIVFGNPSLYQQTMQNVAAEDPDFHVDLGDTFAMDNVTTQAQANSNYLNLRSYFGLMSGSAPVFLALGNHEQEEGWHLSDTGNLSTSPPVMSTNAREMYYLNPDPLLDSFYSGNTDTTYTAITSSSDHTIQDYYAWTWGDALFVVIDPYWYTTVKPYVGNMGGGEPGFPTNPQDADRWRWTLGFAQYQWLEQTLKNSTAKYKFIFAHQVAGGMDDYGRGGANAVPYVEWGGYDTDGTTYDFPSQRPSLDDPDGQMLVKYNVTAFFHGHDHEFAYEKRDGVIYQLVPMAADATYGFGFGDYHTTDPFNIAVLPNSGHLRVTVSPSQVTVDYVRAFLPGDGTNGQIAYSYSIAPQSTTAIPTFNPAPGNYTTQQSVSLSDATPNSTIHYTTDGSTPNSTSPTYTVPIVVSTTTTINAFASASGLDDSPVASGAYTINNNPPPTVNSISPTSGTTAGGTSVMIGGAGFLAGARVTFGSTAATNVVVVSSTSITANTPAHAAGVVSVTVANSDSQSNTLPNAFTYTNPAPTVTLIAPTSGTTGGGTAITITGTGFLSGATVSFGGTAATNVAVANSTTLTATTPAQAAGSVNVVVTNPDGQSGSLPNGYTYTGVSGGGISFVQANSGPSTVQPSNSSLSVAYPAVQVAGDLNVVAVGWGDTTSTITSVTDTQNNTYTLAVGPTSNTGLRQAIYYAKNIAGGSNTVTVRFNQAAVYPDVRILEYRGADLSNPLDQAGAAVGSGTTANSGSVTTTSANELIFGTGTTGTAFSAAGSGFTNRMIDLFGNIAEDRTVTSTGSYNASATTSSTVWVMQIVTFRNGGQSAPPPMVTGISPVSGTTAGGASVTISGAGFVAGANVMLGSTPATNVNVTSSISITATTPVHAAGAVNVVVTNPDGQSGSLPNGYTYNSPNPAPTVTGISPVSGTTAGGTAVTITGTGFLTGASVTLGSTAATAVNVASSTSITATTPAHTTGVVNVVVTNPDGQSGSLPNGYTYNSPNPAPTVMGISPVSGTTGGGTAITITGTGFLGGASITLGGTAATAVNVASSTTITATTPAHAAGSVNVVVTNPDGQSGSLPNGYTYTGVSGGGISFVQANSGPSTVQPSNSSLSVAYPAVQVAGDLNVVAVGWGDTTSTITSVTDTQNNTYTLAVGPTSNTGLRQAIYYAKNIAGGSNTVTVRFNQAAVYPDVRILEYRGADLSNPLDQAGAAVGSGTTANSGSVTTTSANELIFGTGTTGTAFSAAGSGFTNRMIDLFGNIAEDRTVTSTGSYNASATTSSTVWVMQIVTFR
jgi:Chitobiase/beta-hexosaminidase C-terminal domain/IPT/TIG domain/Calcineurin-like phosphoesterase